jgi:hypothetical protein
LIWAELFDDVPCNDSDFAEVLSALALLMKCEQEILSLVGTFRMSTSDPDRDACLLLRSMHTKFTKLVKVYRCIQSLNPQHIDINILA